MQFINVHGFAPDEGIILAPDSSKGIQAMLMLTLQMDGMPLIVKNLPVSIPTLDMSHCMWVV